MTRAVVARTITLGGYFGLWLLLLLWYGWLAPSATLGKGLVLGFLLIPLLAPLHGLITGKSYTYAWSSMLSLLYFAHAIGEAWTLSDERVYAFIELVLSLMWFGGALMYLQARKSERRPASPQTH